MEPESQVTTLEDAPPAPKARGRRKVELPDDVETVKGANSDPTLSGRMALLTVHPTSEFDGKEALFVGLNGYSYLIPRGKPCKVPIEVAYAANPMVISYHHHPDGTAERIETPRNPVTIVPL